MEHLKHRIYTIVVFSFLLIFGSMVVFGQFEGTLDYCESYSECDELDCIGYSRSCFAGECSYSDCLADTGMSGRENVKSFKSTLNEYEVETENTFGLKPIIMFAGKVMVVFFVGFIIALIIGVMNVKGAFKFVLIGGFLILVMFLVVYLFGGHNIIFNLLGIDRSVELSHDQTLLVGIAESRGYDMSKNDITGGLKSVFGNSIVDANEYLLFNEEDEVSFTIIVNNGSFNIANHDISKINSYRKKVISGQDIMETYDVENGVIYWNNGNRFYYLAGPKEIVPKVARDFISGAMDYPDAQIPLKTDGSGVETIEDKEYDKYFEDNPNTGISESSFIVNNPDAPFIGKVYPENDSYSIDSRIRFEVVKNKYDIKASSLTVIGVDGWSSPHGDCDVSASLLSCSFNGILFEDDWNHYTIIVEDVRGNQRESQFGFYYDSKAPDITFSVTDGYVARESEIVLEIIESGSGIDSVGGKLDGVPVDISCNRVSDYYSCEVNRNFDDGAHELSVYAIDNVGNEGSQTFEFVFDSEKPTITLSEVGFYIFDENGVDLDSLIVDNMPFDTANCEVYVTSVDGYECFTSSEPRMIQVEDYSGNRAVFENIKTRE